MVENNYFSLASYTDDHRSMEPETIMQAELWDMMLREISIHRGPDCVPTRAFKLIGLSLLQVEMREYSDAAAMEEWEAHHKAEFEVIDPNAPVQLSFDFD